MAAVYLVPKIRSIIVCGDRNGQLDERIERAMPLCASLVEYDHIVTGTYDWERRYERNTDHQVFLWSMRHEFPCTVVPARWRTGGFGAGEGPRRNEKMTQMFFIVGVFALPGGTGTGGMRKIAQRRKIPLFDWIEERWLKVG